MGYIPSLSYFGTPSKTTITISSCTTIMSNDHNHSHHDHGDHDHGHGHGHDHTDDIEPAIQSLIWKQIDFDKIRCLNESETDAGRKIVKKTWQQRFEAEPELVSDADEQLLLFVPYVDSILLQIPVMGSNSLYIYIYIHEHIMGKTVSLVS